MPKNSMEKKGPVKRRNATATREAILRSAINAFARAGYDGAGVREIAAGAGVTAMLVNRYFGSKEKLFAEAIAATMSKPIILTPRNLSSSKLGQRIAATLIEITKTGDTPLVGFRIMLNSASSARAAGIAREEIEKGHQKTLSAALKGPLAAERAAIVLALVAGIQVMRQMIGIPALAKTEPSHLVKLLEPLLQELVEGKPAKRR